MDVQIVYSPAPGPAGITNLIANSEDILAWSLNDFPERDSDTQLAPDGNTTGDVFRSLGNNDDMRQVATLSSATTYNLSVHLKYIDIAWVRVTSEFNSITSVWVDTLNEVIGTEGSSTSNAAFTTAANGWLRLSFDWTTTITNPQTTLLIPDGDNSTAEIAGQVGVWGWQITEGSGVKAYTGPT